jgi:hypothetical protein
MKICKVCRVNQPLNMYTEVGGYYRGKCKPCYREWQRGYAGRIRRTGYYKAIDLKRKYGMTLADFSHLLADQEYKCAICFREVNLVVDHNHLTGEVRGLLCGRCNRALGMLEDNPVLAENLAEYLRKRE